jgi:AcrR family transcriptional regulator
MIQAKITNSNFELLHDRNPGNLRTMIAPTRRKKNPIPQPRGEAFVRAVLEAALTHLAEVGYERFSIPAVAERAAANKTSIYRRWPSKADLVRDTLASAMNHSNEAPDTGSLRGDLIALARTVATFMQSPAGAAIVRIMLVEGSNPEVRALGDMAYREANGVGPWAVVQRAQERGDFNKNVDPSLVLFTIAGAMLHRVFVEKRDVPEALLGQVVDLVLGGAGAKK